MRAETSALHPLSHFRNPLHFSHHSWRVSCRAVKQMDPRLQRLEDGCPGMGLAVAALSGWSHSLQTTPDPHANRVLVLSPPIGDIPMRFGRWKRSRSHFRSLDIEQPGKCWQVKAGRLAGASVHPSACELPTSGLQVAEIIGGGSSCNFYNCLIF